MTKPIRTALVGCCLAAALPAMGQDDGRKWSLTGSVQSDVLIPQEDEKINTGEYSDWGTIYQLISRKISYRDYLLAENDKQHTGKRRPWWKRLG